MLEALRMSELTQKPQVETSKAQRTDAPATDPAGWRSRLKVQLKGMGYREQRAQLSPGAGSDLESAVRTDKPADGSADGG